LAQQKVHSPAAIHQFLLTIRIEPVLLYIVIVGVLLTLRLARLSSQAALTQTGPELNTHKNALQILQSRVIFAA
jgi:hypothetical protein